MYLRPAWLYPQRDVARRAGRMGRRVHPRSSSTRPRVKTEKLKNSFWTKSRSQRIIRTSGHWHCRQGRQPVTSRRDPRDQASYRYQVAKRPAASWPRGASARPRIRHASKRPRSASPSSSARPQLRTRARDGSGVAATCVHSEPRLALSGGFTGSTSRRARSRPSS